MPLERKCHALHKKPVRCGVTHHAEIFARQFPRRALATRMALLADEISELGDCEEVYRLFGFSRS